MRQRGVHAKLRKTSGAEKHFREQAEHSNAARFSRDASIDPTPGYLKGITGEIPVTAEDAAGTLPEIGNDHNVGLIISRAGFQPRLPLAHIVGRSQIRVPVTPPDLQAAKLVDQKEVDHAGNRVGAIHSRGAILQDVDVVNHHKGKEVNVHTLAGPGDAQRTVGDAFAIDQNQSLFGQQAAQVELDSTVTTIADVHVDGSARLLWQKSCQVRYIANPQFFEVRRTVRIHWIGARLFRCRNVRTGDNNLHYCSDTPVSLPRCGRSLLAECSGHQKQRNSHYAPSGTPNQWPLDNKLLSLISVV